MERVSRHLKGTVVPHVIDKMEAEKNLSVLCLSG